jgi:Tol biopolymer transport system component
MIATDPFERDVRAWLHADAKGRVPDHLAAVLAQTSSMRQRPAWSSLERWLPVDTTFRPRLFQTPRLSQALVVAALILGLLAALLLYAGSQQHRLPPPFGPARNGIIISSGNGDIVKVDPGTHTRTTIVGGPTFDFGPGFSRDGTKILFLRGTSDCGQPSCGLSLMVANVDGSGVKAVTPAWQSMDWADWSPDGSRIAFLTANQHGTGRVLGIVNADGSDLKVDIVGRSVYPAGWLPPNGDEILFRGEQINPVADPVLGIYAIHPDGTGERRLTTRPPENDGDFQEVGVSQDGRLISYRDAGLEGGFQVHIIDVASGADSILPGPKHQLGAVFSPDGTKIAYLRNVNGDLYQLVVAPLDGSSPGTLLGKPAAWGPDGPTINNYSWTPDSTALLVNYEAEQVARLVPIDGSPPIDLDHGNLALVTMQRLAP